MSATQLALTIDKVIEKNATVQALKHEQLRQGETIQELKDEQHRQGLLLEDIQGQVRFIAEAVTPLLSNSEAVPAITNTIESHRQEISMTQQ